MKKHALAVLGAGCLWGFMGFFRRMLGASGLSSAGTIFVRCGIAAVLYAVTMLVRSPKDFAVKPKHIWCFLGSGFCSMLLFSYCYFQAMTLMSLSAAAILLYTAPAIVMVLSCILFGEKFTPRKVAALLLAFGGCVLVSGIGGGDGAVTPLGIVYGLGAGLGYALYSIFARLAMDRGYSSNTVNFYSCLLSALGAGAVWGMKEPAAVMFASWQSALLCAAMALFTCYLAYMLYVYGLSGMEPGRASIMATIEPVVATLVGVFIFSEKMTVASACGVALVLSAVALLNLRPKKAEIKE